MTKKRGNNEGTIFKRKDGRWQGQVTTGKDVKTGKSRRATYYGKTKTEVLEQLTSTLNDVKKVACS
jgi:integrase